MVGYLAGALNYKVCGPEKVASRKVFFDQHDAPAQLRDCPRVPKSLLSITSLEDVQASRSELRLAAAGYHGVKWVHDAVGEHEGGLAVSSDF